MSRWTAASDYDYYEEYEYRRKPPTVPCANCQTPVEWEEKHRYMVKVLCRACEEGR